MLGQSAFYRGASATADNRIFVFEVAGLRQTELTAQCEYQIRSSDNAFVRVPFDRMNETMQRIVNLGGRIVNVSAGDLPSASPE